MDKAHSACCSTFPQFPVHKVRSWCLIIFAFPLILLQFYSLMKVDPLCSCAHGHAGLGVMSIKLNGFEVQRRCGRCGGGGGGVDFPARSSEPSFSCRTLWRSVSAVPAAHGGARPRTSRTLRVPELGSNRGHEASLRRRSGAAAAAARPLLLHHSRQER